MTSYKLGPGFSFRIRPNGIYQLRVYDAQTKKSKSISLSTDSISLADQRARDYYDRYKLGKWSPFERQVQDGVSVKDAIKAFHRSKKGTTQPKTIRDYTQTLIQLCHESGIKEKHNLSRITADHISDMIGRGGISEATRLSYYRKLSAVFRWFHERGLIETDIFKSVKRPRENKPIPNGLSDKELNKLIESARTLRLEFEKSPYYHKDPDNPDWLANAFLLLAYTGLRPSEASRLKWDHIEWPDPVGYINVKGKTKTKSERTVTMIPKAFHLLDKLYKEARSTYVLTNHSGRSPIAVTYTNKLFREARNHAGLPGKFTLYSLRHTFAREYRIRGGAIHMLKEELGHKRIETTMKYGNINPSERAEYTLGIWKEKDENKP